LNKDGANKKGLLNFDEDGIPYQINRTNYEVTKTEKANKELLKINDFFYFDLR